MPGKLIPLDHFEERIAIKLEKIRNPTTKQWHDARDECIREFKEIYGEIEIVSWPRFQTSSSSSSS